MKKGYFAHNDVVVGASVVVPTVDVAAAVAIFDNVVFVIVVADIVVVKETFLLFNCRKIQDIFSQRLLFSVVIETTTSTTTSTALRMLRPTWGNRLLEKEAHLKAFRVS